MVRKEKSAAAAFVECAERVEWVEVVLRDGRTLQGNVIRNPIRQTGTIVNAVEKIDPADGVRRAKLAVNLVLISMDYLVQK